LFLAESRCGFWGRNPDGSLWRYADRPRLAGQAACMHFEPRELPPCFHPGGRATTDEPITYHMEPYLPSQAQEILEQLRLAALSGNAAAEQAEASFERIRQAALSAQYACQMRFFEASDAWKTSPYDLPANLRKVAERGRIPLNANPALYDALAYGIAKTGLADLPLAARSFDGEAPHPLEQILRGLPSRIIRRAAETARDPVLLLVNKPKKKLNRSGESSDDAKDELEKPEATRDDTKDELIATVVREYRDLSQDIGSSPRPLVDLLRVAIEPVAPLSVSNIRKLLKKPIRKPLKTQ
jgi:hypothetical protein